jgi:hypothetical protein
MEQDNQMMQAFRARLDRALNGEEDVESIASDIDAAIVAQPAVAGLYLLRAELNAEVMFDLGAAWHDYLHAMEITPDRETRLKCTLHQYAAAYNVAVREVREGAEQDESGDEGAFQAIQTRSDELREQALGWLAELVNEYVADEAFALEVLAARDSMRGLDPWQNYLLLLKPLAAHPDSFLLRRHEALFLVELASILPDESGKVPLGYFADFFGNCYHAITIGRALDLISALLDEQPDDVELREMQAELLVVIERYDEAAEAYTRLINSLEAFQAQGDEEAQEEIAEQLHQARAKLAVCQGGPAAQARQKLNDMYSTLDEVEKAQQRLRGFLAERDPQAAAGIAIDPELRDMLDEWKAQVAKAQAEPDAATYSLLENKAEKISASMLKLIGGDRAQFQVADCAQFAGAPFLPWFDELAVELLAQGMQLACWYENLAYNAQCETGDRALGQLWLGQDGQIAITAETVKNIRLRRIFSPLSDGCVVCTGNARGATYFLDGPRSRSFWVFRSTPASIQLQIHRARLQRYLAENPGLTVLPVDGLAGMEAIDNLLQDDTRAIRRAQGYRDIEILGMNSMHKQVFAALVKSFTARLLGLPVKEAGDQAESEPETAGLVVPYPCESVHGSAALARFAELCARGEGSVVILGDQDDVERTLECFASEERSIEDLLAEAEDIDVQAWFADRAEEYAEDECEPEAAEWPEEGVSPLDQLSAHVDVLTQKPHDKVYIATLPTTQLWQAACYLKIGGWNAMPVASEHAALWRYWGEKYGATVASITSDVVEFTVDRPPQTREEALLLAREHYLYCSDIVDQGVESIEALAATLLKAPVWFFWWD